MKSICPINIQTFTGDKLQLVDVRENYEFELYKINLPNVINIPFSEIEEKFNDFIREKNIVLICNNGLRSKSAAKYLEDRNFFQIFYLEGGLIKWHQNNLPIIGNPPEIISHSLSKSGECNNI